MLRNIKTFATQPSTRGSPLLAPIFIGCEVFGFRYLPAFFIVCAVSYLFNMDKSIYTLQERA